MSLIALKSFRSSRTTASFDLVLLRPGHLLREVEQHVPAVGQLRELVREGILLRALEHDRVPDDERRVFGDLLEHAPMIGRVGVRVRVEDSQAPDHRVVEDEPDGE